MSPEAADALSSLLAQSGREAALAFFVFLRVGAVMALLPAFGEQSVPQRVRLVLTLAFTAVVAPMTMADFPPDAEQRPLATGGAEIAAGLVLGFGIRVIAIALQVAGTIAAQAASLSQLFGGATVDPLPTLGQILYLAGLALAMAAGLHVGVAAALVQSYAVFPPMAVPGASLVADWGTARVSEAFALAFGLAMPFMIAAVIYNVALGVINRAMPQLMVSLVGAPALTLGVLAMAAVSFPLILEVWGTALSQALMAPDLALP